MGKSRRTCSARLCDSSDWGIFKPYCACVEAKRYGIVFIVDTLLFLDPVFHDASLCNRRCRARTKRMKTKASTLRATFSLGIKPSMPNP